MSGPNDAPNPPQANDTIVMTTLKNSLCVFIARTIATSATAPTAKRETKRSSRFEAFFLRTIL